ncbi:hypothetical protein EVAR_16230_1 [Eumeta japonica]|uniref:Mariner Mos1 transposase n=1 Tax=Eumeta variegata TaxID=151549 RepID=A0A4C1U5Q0_EUMVA|nr:hypothetical protein EVAR_16230_1 [Eumeta japonica]
MIYYDFKIGVSKEQCLQRLQPPFNNEAPSSATDSSKDSVIDSLQDEEHAERPVSTVIPGNGVRKTIKDDNLCTHHMIQNTLGFRSVAYKILHDDSKMKNIGSPLVPYHLTRHQKSERVNISRQTLKLLNEAGRRIISKIVSGDEMYIPFYDSPTCYESEVWVHKIDPA